VPFKALATGDYDLTITALSNSGLPALDRTTPYFTSLASRRTAQPPRSPTTQAASAHDPGRPDQPRFVQVRGNRRDPAYDRPVRTRFLANPAADVNLYHFRISDPGNFAPDRGGLRGPHRLGRWTPG